MSSSMGRQGDWFPPTTTDQFPVRSVTGDRSHWTGPSAYALARNEEIHWAPPPPPDPEQVAAALEAAADYIETHGWTQGASIDGLGRVCASGAINRGGECKAVVHNALREYLIESDAIGYYTGSIMTWNDAPGRTQQDVTDGLRKAAIRYREKAGI